MKSFNKRFDDLGDHLSPTDIVLRQLREMARFRSMTEYLASLKDGPTSNWPLNRMTRQARRAVEKSLKGYSWDAIEERVREAVRDVLFLWYLYLEVNGRISDQLRPAAGLIAFFLSKLRSQLRERAGLSDARGAWLRASRDFPYPLDAETAAAVEAALAHRVESWIVLRDAETIEDWVFEDPTADEYISDAALASTVRRVERRLKALVRSKVIRSGRFVSLPTSPHRCLNTAPLLDGRWIDVSVLELAELGVILKDCDWTPRESGDSHPLAFAEFVRADAEGDLSPIDDASWLDARQASTDRVRSYRRRRRVIDGRDYVELAPLPALARTHCRRSPRRRYRERFLSFRLAQVGEEPKTCPGSRRSHGSTARSSRGCRRLDRP